MALLNIEKSQDFILFVLGGLLKLHQGNESSAYRLFWT